jgi:hypothetical protein
MAMVLADNWDMQTFGYIHGGVVVFDEGVHLPEGARVCVSLVPTGSAITEIECQPGPIAEERGAVADSGHPSPRIPKKRVEFPLVRTGTPGSLHLTNEQIHEILQQQDIEAVTAQWHVPS